MTEPTLRDWADAMDAMADTTRKTRTLAEGLTALAQKPATAAFELPRYYAQQLDSEIQQLLTSLHALEQAASKVKAKGAYPDFEPTSNPGEMLEPCGGSCPQSPVRRVGDVRGDDGGRAVVVNEYAQRDRFVVWLANQVLRLASKRYRAMVKGSIHYGLITAARDQAAGRPLPPLPEANYPPGATPLESP